MKRALLWLTVTSVVVAGLAMVTVFPTRTYLGQRRSLAAAEQRLEVLSAQNAALASRVKRLNTDTEIERLAREQYRLVKPGEEAYAILPSPTTTAPAPPAGATGASERAKAKKGWLDRVVDTLSFWD